MQVYGRDVRSNRFVFALFRNKERIENLIHFKNILMINQNYFNGEKT
jgi:hypothetical protein